MPFEYDPATDAGRVRLLISDVDVGTIENQIFQDDEIAAFLTLRDQSVFRAAATALRAIAGNEALVQKALRTIDLQTDGPSVADALRRLADSYEATADEHEGTDAGFEVAEMVITRQQYLERIRNEALRTS